MLELIHLSNPEAAVLFHFVLERLNLYNAQDVMAGIDESRRLGVEEGLGEEWSGRPAATTGVARVRRRPPTELEMFQIAFERPYHRLVVLPAIARRLRELLNVSEIIWRVDPEFVSTERMPALESKIDDFLPDGIEEVTAQYDKIRTMISGLGHAAGKETRNG